MVLFVFVLTAYIAFELRNASDAPPTLASRGAVFPSESPLEQGEEIRGELRESGPRQQNEARNNASDEAANACLEDFSRTVEKNLPGGERSQQSENESQEV